jgi:hypothetical protein
MPSKTPRRKKHLRVVPQKLAALSENVLRRGVAADLREKLEPTQLRHQRAIFAVMHSGVRVQRCGNVRPLSLRTSLHEATRVQSPGVLMPRTAISGLVCTTFLVLLGFPAVPQGSL